MSCIQSQGKSAKAALKREAEVSEHHAWLFKGVHPASRVNRNLDGPRKPNYKWSNMISVENPSDLMLEDEPRKQFKSICYDGEVDDCEGNRGGRFKELHIAVKNKRLRDNHLMLEISNLPRAVNRIYLNFPNGKQFCAVAGVRNRYWSPFLPAGDAAAWFAFSAAAGTPPTTSSAPGSSANTSLAHSSGSEPKRQLALSPKETDVIIISSDESSGFTPPKRLKVLQPSAGTSGESSSGSIRPNSSGSGKAQDSAETSMKDVDERLQTEENKSQKVGYFLSTEEKSASMKQHGTSNLGEPSEPNQEIFFQEFNPMKMERGSAQRKIHTSEMTQMDAEKDDTITRGPQDMSVQAEITMMSLGSSDEENELDTAFIVEDGRRKYFLRPRK